MAAKKRLFLLDGMALAYRVYFAFARNPLTNSQGENISIVYGFSQTLFNLLDKEKPDYFAVVFDTFEPTFRHELYKEYKSNRVEMPQDMVEQLPRIEEMLEMLNIPTIRKAGYEADDIIGTLSRRASEEGLEAVIVSGDKDMLQLVDSNIRVLNPKNRGEDEEWLNRKQVRGKLGIEPEQVIDYMALVGDSSDNIPGVKGIGPVTASKLLNKYGNLENILDHIDSLSKSDKSKLQGKEELARLSKKLVTIKCNVQIEEQPSSFKLDEINKEKAFEFYRNMQIPSLAERFASREKDIKTNYILVGDALHLDDFLDRLKQTHFFTFDTETTSTEPMRAELVGLSFSWEKGTAYYIPVKGPDMLTEQFEPFDVNQILDLLKPFFENKEIKKCAHNAKYDMLVLSNHSIEVQGLSFDTMIGNYLIEPSAQQHGLDVVSLKYLHHKKIPTSFLIGSGKKQITIDQAPVDKVKDYACEDADFTHRLWSKLEPKLKELGLQKLMDDVEVPLIYVLKSMEQAGVALDQAYLKEMSATLGKELTDIENQIYDLAGKRFNINSPKQLGVILFDELELPKVRRTKTGYSTDVSVLEELAGQHELPKQILEYRQLSKLKSTYVDALPKLIHPQTGRLHTSYNQTVAATGRLSSSNPNLQNIPIRTEYGRRIRRAFIPRDENHVILDADYSQIELRIMAHLSGDEALIKAFDNDQDVHNSTAARIFNVDQEQVTADQRRKAKTVNFGIMYGMAAYGLAQRLDISKEEAADFIQSYFANYPQVQQFMVDIVHKAREQGFVTTLLNRRRFVPQIKSDNRRMREFAERTAINTPIQGSAADLIKIAMIRIDDRIRQENLDAKMILQVHDELVFDVPKDETSTMEKLVREEMENAIHLSVPIKVEVGTGRNWLDSH